MAPCPYPFSKIAVIWCDLTWPHKSPKFNLHHLRDISTGFKMVVLTTQKSGIPALWRPVLDAGLCSLDPNETGTVDPIDTGTIFPK